MTTSGVGIAKPNTLATQGVDSGLLRTAWANGIEAESLLHDPMINIPALTATINPGKDKQALPNATFINVTPNDRNGKAARDVVLQFIKSLSGSGQTGNATGLLGNEEQMALKYAKFYANDWKHGVSGESFGIDFRELSPTQIYEKIKPLLAQWRGEYRGLELRRALCQVIGTNLTSAPTSLSQAVNPKVYVPSITTQATYDSTTADHQHSIGTAVKSGTAANMHLTVPRTLDLIDWLASEYVAPIEWNGYTLYIMYASPEEFKLLHDPSATNSWASYWIQAAALGDGSLHSVIPGADIVIGDSIVVCRDRRGPTCTIAGNASAYTTTFGYVQMGRNDGRATGTTDNTNLTVTTILGRAAVGFYEPEKAHYEEQTDEYGQYYGVGYFGGDGASLVIWDQDTPDDTSAQSEGSAIVLCQKDRAIN